MDHFNLPNVDHRSIVLFIFSLITNVCMPENDFFKFIKLQRRNEIFTVSLISRHKQ